MSPPYHDPWRLLSRNVCAMASPHASEHARCHSLTHPPPPNVTGRGRGGGWDWSADAGPAARGVATQ
eukprot:117438-Pleurochrysis_carterae.AAC.1